MLCGTQGPVASTGTVRKAVSQAPEPLEWLSLLTPTLTCGMKPQHVTVLKPNLDTPWGSAPSAPQPVNRNLGVMRLLIFHGNQTLGECPTDLAGRTQTVQTANMGDVRVTAQ